MSIKLIAFIVLCVGVVLLASFMVYEGRRRIKEQTLSLNSRVSPPESDAKPATVYQPQKPPSVHDFFPEDQAVQSQPTPLELSRDSGDISKPDAFDAAASQPVSNRSCSATIFYRLFKHEPIYDRMEDLFSGDFRVAPNLPAFESLATHESEQAINTEFGFYLTDRSSGHLRLVVLVEDDECRNVVNSPTKNILNRANIPVYVYDASKPPDDNELYEAIYGLSETATNE